MNIRKTMLLALVVLMPGVGAWAQGEYPKAEVAADFSLAVFNPSADFASSHNLFGGGGSVTYNFTRFIGIKADLQGYGSQTNAFNIPAGTRFGSVVTTTPLRFNANGNLFTYLFGPQIKSHGGKFQPFAEALFGGAHANVYANVNRIVANTLQGIGGAPSQNAFAMAIGGGLDYKVSRVISIRPAQLDYLLTRFGNRFSRTNQSSFHYAGGIVFSFGGGS
jgi:outer membrane immunogenic protein